MELEKYLRGLLNQIRGGMEPFLGYDEVCELPPDQFEEIRPDNHWLDCLVGCAVAASMEGAKLFGTEFEKEDRPQRIRLSQIQKGKKLCRN